MGFDNRVPFKKDGGLWFTKPRDGHPNLVWKSAESFDADMKLVSYQKTDKGDFFLWADNETNATYPMTLEVLCEMPLRSLVEDGYIEGTWTVCQRGNKFSLLLVEEFTA